MKKALYLADISRELVDFFFEVQPPLDLPLSVIVNKARTKHLSLYNRYTLMCQAKFTSKISLTEISTKYDILVKNINEVLFLAIESGNVELIRSMRELSDIVEEVGISIWEHHCFVAHGINKKIR